MQVYEFYHHPPLLLTPLLKLHLQVLFQTTCLGLAGFSAFIQLHPYLHPSCERFQLSLVDGRQIERLEHRVGDTVHY